MSIAGVTASWELDEKVEEEEEDAEEHENGAAMKMFAVHTRERANETGRDSFENGFFAKTVERANSSVAGECAAKPVELIADPNGKIIAIAPEIGSAHYENAVAEERKNSQFWANSPSKHKASQTTESRSPRTGG
jgi:hypothetical protein